LHVKRNGILVLALLAVPAFAELQEWRLDSAHSAAHFSVRHMMVSNVRGQLGKVSGTLRYDQSDPKTATVEATIDVTGIDTRNEKRDAHLKSPDFFDVAQFPSITFKSTKVEAAGDGKLRVTGDLTLHGVTKPVTLMVEGPTPPIKDARGSRIGASATATISRKDFGMTWNRAIETGGFVVSDEVAITIDAELTQPAGQPAERSANTAPAR
jgi:polyisoprenoid-binding protein YceI